MEVLTTRALPRRYLVEMHVPRGDPSSLVCKTAPSHQEVVLHWTPSALGCTIVFSVS